MHPRITVDAVLRLAETGASVGDIAAHTGVPRRTVRDWLAGAVPHSVDPGRCGRCGQAHDLAGLDSPYVYLLGLYLGDGCLSEHPRAAFRLRVFLDLRYPMIIDECAAAIRLIVPRNKIVRTERTGNYTGREDLTHIEVSAFSKIWPCLFPQHGRGLKHHRAIVLAHWQREMVRRRPGLLLRGLIQSDGCRSTNTGTNWAWPRYSFSNRSADIRKIFCEACALLGIRYTFAPDKVYVSRKADVAKLDEFIGPKR